MVKKNSFTDYFSLIADHRQQGKVWHPLISVFFIAVAAAIASCDDWEEAVCWAEEKIGWIKKFVSLPHGVPSESTFQRVFRMINPKQFEKCFVGWARELTGEGAGRNVAIDGKTLRGAKENAGGKSAVHIVSAYLCDHGLTLGEVKTDEKSNEKTAIPGLLKLLSIEGSIVTIDAAGTFTDIAKQIIAENKADYVLALKANQPSMYKDAVLFFTGVDIDNEPNADDKIREAAVNMPAYISAGDACGGMPAFLDYEFQSTQMIEKGHGRIERRIFVLAQDVSWISRYHEWEGLKAIGMAVTISTKIKTNETSADCRFFLCSIKDTSSFSNAVRNHWQIESHHWTLDVTFSEDKSRARKDNEPQNLAMLRRLALNLLKIEKQNDNRRESYKTKRKRAMMNNDFLEKVMISNIQ